MKIFLAAATALAMSGSAFAYQTYDTDMDPTTTATISVDPTVAITPPMAWTPEQRLLWEQHMTVFPSDWTAAERAAFLAAMEMPPANWTIEQRTLYGQHIAYLPPSWTPAQRAEYEQQIAFFRTPWVTTTETAAVAPVGDRIVQPSNASPEHDARGIAVISDPAVVPPGYNGFTGTAMGGPLVDPVTGETIEGADAGYPPCTATVTDNCIQLYERGVRASLASWNASTGGLDQRNTGMGGPLGEDEVGDNTPEDDALDIDVEPDGDIDVDGDLDGDGDNDLE